MSQKNITDELRAKYTADLATFLAEKYDTDFRLSILMAMTAGSSSLSSFRSWLMKPRVPMGILSRRSIS